MMKHVLVVGGQSYESYAGELLENTRVYLAGLSEAAGLEVAYSVSFFDTIDYLVGEDGIRLSDSRNGGRLLESYDLVLLRVKVAPYRAFAQIVSTYLEKRGVKCVNADYVSSKPRGKLAQMVALREMDVPVPRTLYASVERMLELAPKSIAFPMVVKGIHAAKGRDNYLVNDIEQLRGLLAGQGGQPFVAQQFIPNDCDYRILIIGDQHMVIRRTGGADTHLNNVSTGGSAEILAADFFPPYVYEQCRAIMTQSDLDWAGIDVVQDKNTGKLYFLEVNSLPQLDSGAFVDEKAGLLAQYLEATLFGAA
jgi:glutathione synthase/RimK-type ligase-like ATP-grasp enzyme